jgi:hypothetical protein
MVFVVNIKTGGGADVVPANWPVRHRCGAGLFLVARRRTFTANANDTVNRGQLEQPLTKAAQWCSW